MFFNEGFDDIFDRYEETLLVRINPARYEVHYAVLSDTIVIGIWNNRMNDPHPYLIMGRILAALSQLFTSSATPLLTRGYVCEGEFLLQGSSLIGPAVDEAASYYEMADAAVIWCSPALTHAFSKVSVEYEPGRREHVSFYTLVTGSWISSIEVPLKGGRSVQAAVVCPFHGSFKRYFSFLDRYEEKHSSSLEAKIKIGNTRKCANRCIEFLDSSYRKKTTGWKPFPVIGEHDQEEFKIALKSKAARLVADWRDPEKPRWYDDELFGLLAERVAQSLPTSDKSNEGDGLP